LSAYTEDVWTLFEGTEFLQYTCYTGNLQKAKICEKVWDN